jgi:hypothetical protein
MGGIVVVDGPIETLRPALQLTLDIDNPRTELNPESMDCSSCHLANRIRDRAVDQGHSLMGLTGYRHPFRPLEPHSEVIARLDGDSTVLQRAFGYLSQQPVISARAIHESAEVADAIERLVSAP